ncbi:FtsQ-type POTRA domain-containing protein [Sphingomonas sinipercae]|uniref:Cell division protein FtsQ n=1 Tax=Sphingomonas sinipercae TaxID=2714944 RepID=A0A6G7ZQ23_9SPHN|nr:cell division protein FtsQ/DivIB [Sphingomonas sinipercae]QIL03071.1 FtsQ-type POTRA domain-containing protein [Sphingomonas sinipercae]
MTAARVRRGGAARPKKAAPRVVPKKLAKKLPMAEAKVNRWAGIVFGLFVALIVAVVLVALEVPSKAMTAAGEAVGNAGFRVSSVDIRGTQHMDSAPVYAVALDQKTRALPLVDVSAIREQLLRYGWVKDARVSRRFPDTLVVDIVERTPAALWQDRNRLALIDADGVVLERVPVDQMPDLPLLIGPGANLRERDLSRLMASVPTLKPQLVSANWVGGRRWDLQFQSGETVLLPEGKAGAAALTKFAEMDKSTGLLGRGMLRFDLRLGDKMIVRLPKPVPASDAKPVNEG